MLKERKRITIDDVMNEARRYISRPESLDLIYRAYEYADEKHEGQYRKSGEPYVTHVLHVAYILAQLTTSPNNHCCWAFTRCYWCDVSLRSLQRFNEEIAIWLKV